MRAPLAIGLVAALLLVPGPATAAVSLQHTSPSLLDLESAAPVAFVPTSRLPTVLGPAATSATTTVSPGPAYLPGVMIHLVSRATEPVLVVLRLDAVQGGGPFTSVSLHLADQPQIGLGPGEPGRTQGEPVVLPPGASLAISGTARSPATPATLEVSVVVRPVGQPGTTLVERWTLAVT